ncbi:MBL fold metallo-hydrolase [Oscillatoria sp. CS-180]|uniref:MBL fold metallo-hydrolase n=1 Tax=Oscillatoria sp. CS-180 TaxID=3021720 RepID=UPI00233146E8|nr:MBL fold metallo-hydrolase [Oscillatoria sp. CS-180]MDB9525569.1 MBL fold metallo-hydrolase [Oscillatoria sp. CS-180]
MQRRRFVQQLGAGFITALGLGVTSTWRTAQAQSSGVTLQWLGHTCFLFEGDGRRILVNPFQAIGCTAGFAEPTVSADVVLISSRLFDEGGNLEGLPGNPPILTEQGEYELSPIRMRSVEVDHDRRGGRRFGKNLIWRWEQGGLNIVHMGGAASPISVEAQIQLGRPDVMLVPVGGGPKAYNAEEAIAAIRALNPRIVIPTHYLTSAADPETCDIEGLQPFMELMQNTPTRQADGNSVTLSTDNLPGGDGMIVQLLTYSLGDG